MTEQSIAPSVSLVNGRPATTSQKIAEHFGKPHDRVLKDIRNLCGNCPESFSAVNFDGAEYTDEQGKPRPMYTVFFDGFMLLVMGYTGKKALGMKLAYIAAFNAMREQLEGKKPTPALESPEERKRRLARERLRRYRERKRAEQLAITENAGRAPKKWATLPEHAAKINALSADAEQKANECIKAVSDLGFALLFRPACLDPEVSAFGKALERNLPALSFAAQTSVKALCDMVGAYMSGLTAAQE